MIVSHEIIDTDCLSWEVYLGPPSRAGRGWDDLVAAEIWIDSLAPDCAPSRRILRHEDVCSRDHVIA